MGTRLCKLKKTENGLTKLGLTEKLIDRLQHFYGMDIRSNVGDLDIMKIAIFVVLFRVGYFCDYFPQEMAEFARNVDVS